MSNYKSNLQSNNNALSANNLDLQSLIEQANNLPDAGGVELPELTNPAAQTEVFSGKQVIDEEGNIITGTFSIDNELSEQNDLIVQITEAVNNLPDADSGPSIETCTVTIKEKISPITPTFYYTDATTMTIKNIATKSATLLVPKNTIIAMTDWESFNSHTGCEKIFYYVGHAAYQILSDSTFTIQG